MKWIVQVTTLANVQIDLLQIRFLELPESFWLAVFAFKQNLLSSSPGGIAMASKFNWKNCSNLLCFEDTVLDWLGNNIIHVCIKASHHTEAGNSRMNPFLRVFRQNCFIVLLLRLLLSVSSMENLQCNDQEVANAQKWGSELFLEIETSQKLFSIHENKALARRAGDLQVCQGNNLIQWI